MSEEMIKNTLIFLSRVELRGEEAQALVLIQLELNKQLQSIIKMNLIKEEDASK